MSYGDEYNGYDQYGGGVPVEYIAVGALDDWNALTQAQRDFYDNRHYLNYGTARTALPADGAFTDFWETHQISEEVDNAFVVNWPADMNGYGLTIRGFGNTLNSTYTSNDFVWTSAANGTIIIKDLNPKYSAVKLSAKAAFRFDQVTADATVDNCHLDGNGGATSYLVYLLNSTGEFCIQKSSAKDCDVFMRVFNGTPVVNCINCRTSNVSRGLLISTASVNIKNNYFQATTTTISGTVVDLGGNTTSDTDAPEVARQNRSIADSFEDQIDWIPKDVAWMEGVEITEFATYANNVTTVDNYWVSPNGRAVLGGGGYQPMWLGIGLRL